MKTWIEQAEDRKVKAWRWAEYGESGWTIQLWAVLIIHISSPKPKEAKP
jgi:hypothetical protein